MKETGRESGRGQNDQQQQLELPLRELVREALLDTATQATQPWKSLLAWLLHCAAS